MEVRIGALDVYTITNKPSGAANISRDYSSFPTENVELFTMTKIHCVVYFGPPW